MRKIKIKNLLLVCTMATFIATMSFGCTRGVIISSDSNIESNSSSDKESINEDNDSEMSTDEEDKNEKEEFILYSMDANTEEETVLGKVEINKNESLEAKLTELANTLSKEAFSSLPLEFVEIKNVEGKKVALFNFNESGKNADETQYDKYEGKSWVGNYFAGSTGGRITEHSLQRTLLQEEYSGEWIDGIEFTYKGNTFEFDHVPSLSEITYK